MRIERIDFALGDKKLDIADLEAMYPSWNVSAVAERTGIHEVYHLSNVSQAELILSAAESLSKELAGTVDTFVFVSQSNLDRFPLVSAEVCSKLGLDSSVRIIDLNHGCSGFVVALEICSGLFKADASKRAIVVTWDTYSSFMVRPERSTSLLFSDVAAVTLLTQERGFEIVDSHATFSFESESSLKVSRSSAEYPNGLLFMNGPEVYNFARTHVGDGVRILLERQGLKVKDVDAFFFHQASKLVLDSICRDLNIPKQKAPTYFPRFGNVTSSAIPLLIHQHSAMFTNPGTFIFCGFGVGLQCMTLLVRRDN